jgi:hypothetical protein
MVADPELGTNVTSPVVVEYENVPTLGVTVEFRAFRKLVIDE